MGIYNCNNGNSKRRKLIFLDIDGVIIPWDMYSTKSDDEEHPNGVVSKKAIRLLDKLINDTGAIIVVSSSLGNNKSIEKLSNELRNFGLINYDKVTDKIKTDLELSCRDRGAKIHDYLECNNMCNVDGTYSVDFVILDDEFKMEGLEEHFVKCKMEDGFKDKDFDKALRILGNTFNKEKSGCSQWEK